MDPAYLYRWQINFALVPIKKKLEREREREIPSKLITVIVQPSCAVFHSANCRCFVCKLSPLSALINRITSHGPELSGTLPS